MTTASSKKKNGSPATQSILPFDAAACLNVAARKPGRHLRVTSLFSGIGGFELAFGRQGHRTIATCEIEPSAQRVLSKRFPDIPLFDDIREMGSLPVNTDIVVGGFPCQDLSQAGKGKGITGAKSGIVNELFRLIRKRPPPWVLLENVSFMLQLGKGKALRVIVDELEALGYKWAYRVLNSWAFGVPQRRMRVYLLASLEDDPRKVLLADEVGAPAPLAEYRDYACGFFWTEGIRGLGWAVDGIPTLKGGSTVGIPSAPAILLPNGRGVVKPHIGDGERIQGFDAGWTEPVEEVTKTGHRWKLVGNAVTVQVAEWVADRLAHPAGDWLENDVRPIPKEGSWPTAGFCVDPKEGRFSVKLSAWPKRVPSPHLMDFLDFDRHPPTPLSAKATRGFLSRTEVAKLNFPDGFISALRVHLRKMEALESARATLAT